MNIIILILLGLTSASTIGLAFCNKRLADENQRLRAGAMRAGAAFREPRWHR